VLPQERQKKRRNDDDTQGASRDRREGEEGSDKEGQLRIIDKQGRVRSLLRDGGRLEEQTRAA
jgi:hypothetical protein